MKPKKLILPTILSAAIATSAAAQNHEWTFGDTGGFLEDTAGSADFTVTGGVTQTANTAVFDGTGTLDTGANLFGNTNVNSVWTVTSVFSLDTLPTVRTALYGEYEPQGNNNSRGWETFVDSGDGRIVTEFANSTAAGDVFFRANNTSQGGNASLVLQAGVLYELEVTYDLSQVNADISDLETAIVTYSLTDLTNSGATIVSTVTRTDVRNLSDGSGSFTIGGRNGATGNLLDGTFESLTIVPEPGTWALLSGLLALGAVMIRRRK